MLNCGAIGMKVGACSSPHTLPIHGPSSSGLMPSNKLCRKIIPSPMPATHAIGRRTMTDRITMLHPSAQITPPKLQPG